MPQLVARSRLSSANYLQRVVADFDAGVAAHSAQSLADGARGRVGKPSRPEREWVRLGADRERLVMASRILLAHPGTQYSLRLARELERLQVLESFHTCLALRADSYLAHIVQPLSTVFGMQRHVQNRL